MNGLFPDDSDARKTYPVFSGFLQYFPAAVAAVANHSFSGNEKHNPGQPLHHDRAKSADEADALARHLMEGDYVGMAWRAMSLLQKHLEANGAPIAPAARNVLKAKPFPNASDLPESPLVAALIELHDEDRATSGLKAGEAYEHNPAAYAAATARITDEE